MKVPKLNSFPPSIQPAPNKQVLDQLVKHKVGHLVWCFCCYTKYWQWFSLKSIVMCLYWISAWLWIPMNDIQYNQTLVNAILLTYIAVQVKYDCRLTTLGQKQHFNTPAWTYQLIIRLVMSSFRCVGAGKTSHCAMPWPSGLVHDTPAVEKRRAAGESDSGRNSANITIWMGVNVALGTAEQQQLNGPWLLKEYWGLWEHVLTCCLFWWHFCV